VLERHRAAEATALTLGTISAQTRTKILVTLAAGGGLGCPDPDRTALGFGRLAG
jgi:hypothetical protein